LQLSIFCLFHVRVVIFELIQTCSLFFLH
jgi:hypothetical protein